MNIFKKKLQEAQNEASKAEEFGSITPSDYHRMNNQDARLAENLAKSFGKSAANDPTAKLVNDTFKKNSKPSTAQKAVEKVAPKAMSMTEAIKSAHTVIKEDVSTVQGLPDIVSVQKKVFPRIFSSVVSTQPTTQPVATAFALKKKLATDDGSGWTSLDSRIDRWSSPVGSEKIKTEITTEALQDLRALGWSEDTVIEHIADQITDNINRDILTKLSEISTAGAGMTISAASRYEQGRMLYAEIMAEVGNLETTTGAQGSYVVCGGQTYGLLLSTGWVSKVAGRNFSITASGIAVINDKYSISDYVTVGVKDKFGDIELSSLVFSPFYFNDSVFEYTKLKVIDSKSLNPVHGVIARYAVTAAPLNDNTESTGARDIPWGALTSAHKSDLSITHSVTVS